MSEEKEDIREKPKEILELERIYNMTFEPSTESLDSFTVFFQKRAHYFLDAEKIIGFSIEEAGITDISPIVKMLKDLKGLNCSYNLITDIEGLDQLERLEFLIADNNRIRDISPVLKLKHLRALWVGGNRIDDYSGISQLSYLTDIRLTGNNIRDISFIAMLKNIDLAFLGNNDISDISVLADFNKGDFELSNNKVCKISKQVAQSHDWLSTSLTDRKTFKGLCLLDNPLEFPPPSVIQLGPETTKKYYEDAEQYGHAALSEGRIIFVGDGGSGKSSIIEKMLYNNQFDPHREQTNGIKIEHFSFSHPDDGRTLNFHTWDFGGQEIQHAVHKFFFTEGCLYVVVLDNRKEDDPEYWLQQVESLGGGAPVLVVFNKQDQNNAETADRKYLKEKYPNIVGFYDTSCKSGFGIDDFRKSLNAEAVKLRTVAEQFPNNWLAIKKAIEEHTSGKQHYLTFEAYQEICKRNHLLTEDAQRLLLRYFNTIGTVTWFGGNTYLQFLHVLNPAWITQGVYKILTAQKTTNLLGQIKVSDFKELLQPVGRDDYSYDEQHYGYILSMMDKFNLCYTSDGRNLLIPSAFGKVPKVEYSDYKGAGVRTYILQFRDYMPIALIHRFTAQQIEQAVDNNYWYTGIVIKDIVGEATAMVHADKEAKRLYVRIKGESVLGLWEYVRRLIAVIAASYAKIPYEELVELDEASGSTVNYADLVSHLKAGKQVYFHPRLQKDYNVGYLMNLFEPKEQTTDKILQGAIVLNEREAIIKNKEVPQYVIQILNNNNPVVNTQVNTTVNVDIDVNIVNETGSTLKGDAGFLLEQLADSNKTLSEALQKVIQFADDAKAAKNSGDVKEKGWGRKLKGVMETLGNAGEQVKNIADGGGILMDVIRGIGTLAKHFGMMW